jgi:hypothetical protein
MNEATKRGLLTRVTEPGDSREEGKAEPCLGRKTIEYAHPAT